MREKLNEGIVKDPKICSIKPVFDFLQKRELTFLAPIDVTNLVDLPVIVAASLPKILLWNQISDPNLGIHDFLEADGEASFKHVVIDGEILPVEDFVDKGREICEIELVHVMNNVHKIGKSISYFVAEGLYNGTDGVHFCLIPFNDQLSCDVLKTLFSDKFVNKVAELQESDLQEELDKVNLDNYFNPDAVTYCQDLYLDHFKKSLGLIAVPA